MKLPVIGLLATASAHKRNSRPGSTLSPCGTQCVLDLAASLVPGAGPEVGPAIVSAIGAHAEPTATADVDATAPTASPDPIAHAICAYTKDGYQTIVHQVEPCLAPCPPSDSLYLLHGVADMCGWPRRSRRSSVLALFALQGPALICLALRLYERWRTAARMAVDDYLAMAIVPFFLTFLVIGQYAAALGFGVDIWTVSAEHISMAVKTFYIDEILYLNLLALTKLVLLFMYLRVLAPQSLGLLGSQSATYVRCYGRFRVAARVVIAWTLLSSALFVLLATFQCLPVDTVWTWWTSPSSFARSGRCLNVNALVYAAAGCSIAQDVAILALPLPVLHRLPLPTRAATATAAVMFSLGVFVLITSCVRLRFLVRFSQSTNPTWDNTDTLVWSGLEVSMSVLVTSLPTVRVVLHRWCDHCRGHYHHHQHWSGRLSRMHTPGRFGRTNDPDRSGVLPKERDSALSSPVSPAAPLIPQATFSSRPLNPGGN